MKFSLGGTEHERIEVELTGYERKPAGEYYDDNWVRGHVSIKVGGFSGGFNAAFLAEDFSRFLGQLGPVYESLSGKAEFNTLEGQLMLAAKGDGKGHIEVRGEAMDVAGTGNRLTFYLELDQTQLAGTITELRNVVSEFPVRSG